MLQLYFRQSRTRQRREGPHLSVSSSPSPRLCHLFYSLLLLSSWNCTLYLRYLFIPSYVLIKCNTARLPLMMSRAKGDGLYIMYLSMLHVRGIIMLPVACCFSSLMNVEALSFKLFAFNGCDTMTVLIGMNG